MEEYDYTGPINSGIDFEYIGSINLENVPDYDGMMIAKDIQHNPETGETTITFDLKGIDDADL